MLQRRVEERFPGAGLARVVAELRLVAQESIELSRWAAKPNVPIRALSYVLAGCIVAVIVWLVLQLRVPEMRDTINFTQFIEACLSAIAFIGASIFFLVTYEARVKRQRVLRAMNSLRAMAHIVDMHQLTKDPDRYLLNATVTESSPKREMSAFELGRYFDYCRDALALISKLAALQVEGFDDEVVLRAVDEIETLALGLSTKISQKIALLSTIEERNELASEGGTG